MRDGLLIRRWISSFKTVALPIVETTIRTLCVIARENYEVRHHDDHDEIIKNTNKELELNHTYKQRSTIGVHR